MSKSITSREADSIESIWFTRSDRVVLFLFRRPIRRILGRVINRAYECGLIHSQELHGLHALKDRMLGGAK